MKLIMRIVLLFSICLMLGALATSAADKTDAINKALAIPDNQSKLEMKLWYHSGDNESGYLLLISGDGTVSELRTPRYPIVSSNKPITNRLRLKVSVKEVRRIAEMFTEAAILQLPKLVPELIEPEKEWPKHMRYTVSIAYDNNVLHEFEHPDIHFSDLKQTPEAKRLIETIISAVSGLRERIQEEDRHYLTTTRMLTLLADDKENLWLELRDIQGLWGGTAIRLSDYGVAQWINVRPPQQDENGMQIDRSSKKIGRDIAATILRNAIEKGIFDIVRQRENGIPDEGQPEILIDAVVDQGIFSRSVWLWNGEALQNKDFAAIREQMRAIACKSKEQHNKPDSSGGL